jgi:peptidoglycan-N-acetylglucosamine deacetylase
MSVRSSRSSIRPLQLMPNPYQSLPGYLTGANGPLEPETRKQIRIAEEARIRTRQLVKPDRSNVNCAYMKCIALTYDDGPEPQLTGQLLDILKEKQAVATFFVLGNRVKAEASTLNRAAMDQNEIGNHSWSHADLTNLSNEQIQHELDHTNMIIREVVGVRPKLMRPPMGKYDMRVAEVAHMPLVLWNVDPRDWWDRDAHAVYLHTVTHAAPGKIILLHDTHETTIQASAWIVDELQRQGYVLVTVSELFGITENTLSQFTNQRLFYR